MQLCSSVGLKAINQLFATFLEHNKSLQKQRRYYYLKYHLSSTETITLFCVKKKLREIFHDK